MKRSALPSVAVVAFAVVVVAGHMACSSASRSQSGLSPSVLTPGIGVVHSIDDAFFMARVYTLGNYGPPIQAHDPQSISYVATTYGEALREFQFNAFRNDGVTQNYPDSAPVWVIVAYGDFGRSGIHVLTPAPATAVWLVFVKNSATWYADLSDDHYDLSQLGNPVQVPIPLPAFPTPTHFGR